MSEKITLITGASRGIGRAIATEFAKAGYNLIMTCEKNKEMLDDLAKSLSDEYGVKCICHMIDISDPDMVNAVFDSIGQLDVLINNAGISYVGLLTDMTVDDWHRTMGVNLDSLFYTCKNAVPIMLRQGHGSIINISSVWGHRGASMEVAYSTSKGGVDAFTKALAKELAPSGINVNAISCGLIDTDMNSHLSREEIDGVIEEIPADKIGTPSDVAKLVLSIAKVPSYVTGQIIGINGGWY